MARQPSVDQAIERARRVQDDRLNAVRHVAEKRQALTDVHEQTARELVELQARIAERIRQAEREDVLAYNAALNRGWSAEELKRIGFTEPVKTARVRRRAARRESAGSGRAASSSSTRQTPAEAAPEPPGDGHD